MEFIGAHWNKNHILARNRDFFCWMYTDCYGCNFIIARDQENRICGMEGYIKYNSDMHPDIAGTMWKVIKNKKALLGMEIGQKMYEIVKPRCDVAPGLTKRALQINQMLGYAGGKMDHFYILGEKSEYKIAVVKERKERIREQKKKNFVPITSFDMLASILDDSIQRKKTPYKDIYYIWHRYMEHPVYLYELFGIQNADCRIRSVFVGRCAYYEEAKIYKIIDFFGEYEDLKGTAPCFYEMLDANDYEYIDLYCYGVPEDCLNQAGFFKREANEVIIPNYFSPFEKRNIDIYFAASISDGLNVFRGDGDQDRPS